MSKKQRYSLRGIRGSYTYSVSEVAEKYAITPDTVFRWIRDEGLKRISNSKKYYVHGSDLAQFIKKKNAKNKCPCKADEIYCVKCRKQRNPKPDSLTFKKMPNKTIRVSGRCPVCNTRMNKPVSGKKWSKNHPFYPNKDTPSNAHSGEHISPRKCQTQEGEQLCLNITL